jgi:hypothetical protein
MAETSESPATQLGLAHDQAALFLANLAGKGAMRGDYFAMIAFRSSIGERRAVAARRLDWFLWQ